MALIEQRDSLEGGNVTLRLPGVQKGDMATRNFKPEIRVFSVRFSPTAQSWAAATTEGLLIFSLDKGNFLHIRYINNSGFIIKCYVFCSGIVFDPFNLSLEITTKSTRDNIAHEEYSTAFIMSLRLNESNLIQEIIEQIPHKESEYYLFLLHLLLCCGFGQGFPRAVLFSVSITK